MIRSIIWSYGQPEQFLILYSTFSSKSGQVYASNTTATLTYDLLDHFVNWNAGSSNQDLYVYDASGTRVLRRTTTGSGTTMLVYAFGLEQHTYTSTGSHTSDLYYYSVTISRYVLKYV